MKPHKVPFVIWLPMYFFIINFFLCKVVCKRVLSNGLSICLLKLTAYSWVVCALQLGVPYITSTGILAWLTNIWKGGVQPVEACTLELSAIHTFLKWSSQSNVLSFTQLANTPALYDWIVQQAHHFEGDLAWFGVYVHVQVCRFHSPAVTQIASLSLNAIVQGQRSKRRLHQSAFLQQWKSSG